MGYTTLYAGKSAVLHTGRRPVSVHTTAAKDHDIRQHTGYLNRTLRQQDHDNSCNWVHKTGYVTHNIVARPWQDKNAQAKDHTQHSKIHTEATVTKLSLTILLLVMLQRSWPACMRCSAYVSYYSSEKLYYHAALKVDVIINCHG